MKIRIVVYSNDPETVWNAFCFANFALARGNEVRVFLLGKGVEAESIDINKFKVREQIEEFVCKGGKVFACGTRLKIRGSEGSACCPASTMKDLYDMVGESDKVLML